MANDRTITIRIINDSVKSSPSPDAKGKEESNPKANADKKNMEAAKKTAFASWATTAILGTVKTALESGYSRYVSLTENYKSQVAQQNIQAHLTRISNVASSTATGAILGATAFGPIGAVVGAFIGATTSIANNEIQRQRTLSEQQRSVHEEAYALYFNTARAGMINFSRGTEN